MRFIQMLPRQAALLLGGMRSIQTSTGTLTQQPAARRFISTRQEIQMLPLE
jgi:hypothetical protein